MKYFSSYRYSSLFSRRLVNRTFSCWEELDKGRFHFRFRKRVDKWRHEGLSPVSVLRGAGVQGGHSLRTENQWSSGGECILRNGWSWKNSGKKLDERRGTVLVEHGLELPRYGLWNVNNTGWNECCWNEGESGLESVVLQLEPVFITEIRIRILSILIFFFPTRPGYFW